MSHKIQLVDQSNPDNWSTVQRSHSWIQDKIGNAEFSSLPDDEGYEPDNCYRLDVKVTG